ncbi:hypothetical protein MACJ_002704 [Theileria orientalis]|uniref:Uncharacterized protein n=1 Tax=Theileria orientalis TaxID=68886 RepID=A0A976QRJ6_THEOR|nr:hypothetical protein MACJ_002704 [Theileria orientalis]
MPNIFLRKKDSTYHEWIYEKVTYSIDYELPWSTSSSDYFNIALYDASDNSNKGKAKFTYYYAYSNGQVVDKVDVFFSILRPNDPLIVSFNRRENKTYNCLYSRLKELVWFYGYNIGYYFFKGDLKVELAKEYSKLSKDKKLTFLPGSNKNEHILVSEYVLGKKKFKKNIYTPDGSKKAASELYSESLFSENTESSTNYLYLRSVANNQFDGVCLYSSSSGTQLLVEFVDGESVTQLRRIGTSEKSQWIHLEKPLTYKNDNELERILEYIEFCLDNKIVVKLDQQSDNTDIHVVESITSATPKPITENEMSVTKGCDGESDIVEGYVCYSHDLKEYYNVHVKGTLNDLRIGGESFKPDAYLELALTIDNNHIYLFDETGYRSEFLYYNPDKDKNLYVYFLQSNGEEHGLKPLLFYYEGQAYKPSNFRDHHNYWLNVNLNSVGKGGVIPKPKNLKDVLDEVRLSSETDQSSTVPPTQQTFPTVKPTKDGGKNHGVEIKNENSAQSFIGGSLGIILGMLGSAIAIFSFWNKPRTFNRIQ